MKDYGSLSRHKWALPFEAVMLGGAVVTAAQGNWKHVAVSLFTLAVSFAPVVIERWARVRLPAYLQVLYVAFIFASMFAGEVLHMYAQFWPWDDIIHFISGLLIGIGGVVWLAALTVARKSAKLPAWLQSVFVFCLVSAVILLWEFAEFTSDSLFGTTSLGPILDTMIDLIYGATGGLIISILLLLHLNNGRERLIDRIIRSYVRLNK